MGLIYKIIIAHMTIIGFLGYLFQYVLTTQGKEMCESKQIMLLEDLSSLLASYAYFDTSR